jgi:hypothetical protein
MKFLTGLFKSAKKQEAKDIEIVSNEIEMLRRRIELLRNIIDDYRSSPIKYQRYTNESTADAYAQLVIDKTKLEMQYLYLTKYH